jgi:2-dehydro-3-deoxy-D-arabinonate dehydratase
VIKLRRTVNGAWLERDGKFRALDETWDALINRPSLAEYLSSLEVSGHAPSESWLAPVQSQEIWAAGVTYLRSRSARMEESGHAGGGSFYDRVYDAERPELFFKGAGWRAVGDGGEVRIRSDARWNVPEPELALCVNSRGEIVGYTIGNDMSSRDIEGENPLYLPQAKVYDGSCALGPAMLVSNTPLSTGTEISIRIMRDREPVFEGATTLAQMRRKPEELVSWLYREQTFPSGCVLLTGTGVVPPEAFTLQSKDRVDITIDAIGTLSNVVA